MRKVIFNHSFAYFQGVLPKRNSRYEESSFMTFVEGPRAMYTRQVVSNKKDTENTDSVNEEAAPDNPALTTIRLEKHGKAGSHFSLIENVHKQDSKKRPVTRSKSFGHDFGDAIPFIDCAEENNSGTESNIIYVQQYKGTEVENDEFQASTIDFAKCNLVSRNELSNSNSYYYSDPGTPRTSSRLAQTDDSGESRDGSFGKRTPKKKFPRLGTFERIKLENRSATLKSSTHSPKVCRTRTGTSARHRRQVSSTVSKEQLLKSDSVSPVLDTQTDNSKESSPGKSPRKGKKGFFSRLFKRGSSNASSVDSEKIEENVAKESQINTDATEMVERKIVNQESSCTVETVLPEDENQPPPDYETSLKMEDTVQDSIKEISTDLDNKVRILLLPICITTV